MDQTRIVCVFMRESVWMCVLESVCVCVCVYYQTVADTVMEMIYVVCRGEKAVGDISFFFSLGLLSYGLIVL